MSKSLETRIAHLSTSIREEVIISTVYLCGGDAYSEGAKASQERIDALRAHLEALLQELEESKIKAALEVIPPPVALGFDSWEGWEVEDISPSPEDWDL